MYIESSAFVELQIEVPTKKAKLHVEETNSIVVEKPSKKQVNKGN